MQIPVLNGIYASGDSDFRTSYPRNMVPVPKATGISQGYLRPADGIVQFADGPGVDRGGINWNGTCYRVMGTKLVSVDSNGNVTTLGDVGGSGQCAFDYSFDRLAIGSSGKMFYWNGTTLTQVTDPDLGTVRDLLWVDGYFMTTDGSFLIVTDLADPFAVNPLKYGSSEADPDQIMGLLKLRNEPHALNRYTVEVFQNVGSANPTVDIFPFQRVEGAQMQRGAIGPHACAVFMERIAFLGSGRNEAPAVWMGANAATDKISTREIEQILAGYTEAQLFNAVMESRVSNGHQLLYLHLPDQCLVFDGAASQVVQEPVWYVLTTSIEGLGQYRARNFVWCYDRWLCGDPSAARLGVVSNALSSHYGELNGWDFSTAIMYNEGRGAILHELELVCLTGNVAFGDDPTIWTSYTLDGQSWSMERPRTAGKQGERIKRIAWLQQGYMRHWRAQKFRGTSDAHIAVARLEATVEAMNV